MKDIREVRIYIKDLCKGPLVSLGVALGLSYPNVKRMSERENFLEDLIHDWLLKVDQVKNPTWESLVNCLHEIGQTGIANRVYQEKG